MEGLVGEENGEGGPQDQGMTLSWRESHAETQGRIRRSSGAWGWRAQGTLRTASISKS